MAINGETVLAVIPLRSGSKRVPGKNWKPFWGQPLYRWMEAAARGSKYIDTLKLSFDADRPAELCTDTASSEDVLRHHLAQMPHDWIILLQATSPLCLTEDIDACIEKAAASEVNNGCISVGLDWLTNGAVYVARRAWIEKHDFSHGGMLKYRMPE